MKDIDDAIAKLQQKYISAVATRNANALIQLYDPKVRVFDAWGVWEYTRVESWQVAVEGWLASNPSEKLQVKFTDSITMGSLELASMTAIVDRKSVV